MKKKTLSGSSLILIFLMTLLAVPNVNAGTFTWNMDSDLACDNIVVDSSYLVTNGYWDAKGFQWDDPDTTYPSSFDYTWQDGVATIWIGDWEHDGPWQGFTVGTVRQGSVWDLSIPPWYDQTTHQPTPLHFLGKSGVSLKAQVRINSQHRTALGWINWLLNPWFSVKSTYKGITKTRKMVWDIVWAWNSWLGIATASPFVDGDENLHLDFYVSEMAQTGEWKTYTVDLLGMAQQAIDRAEDNFGWKFAVDDLYLWSIEANVEGWDYETQFSVDFLEVAYTTPPTSLPEGDLGVLLNQGMLVLFLFILNTSLLALIGLFSGYILAKRVKIMHVAVGSAVYWTVAFINLYFRYLYFYHHESLYQIPAFYALSNLIWWSVFLVPFLNIGYLFRKYTLKHAHKVAKMRKQT
ncbi:MAG: hypothetical protein O2U62_03975 [Candidatus Bathyarchaeota archaeon]|nr:hypothetical protein [Candidatus Bathyarchaeota archaeon]